MAFMVISSKGIEAGRRGLVRGTTVGRAPDCDLCVHDILLSRHHCRIEPTGRGWVVLDLRSRNGTWLDGERVGRRSLRHGDVVRAGNTTLRFMMGELPADRGNPRSPKAQPRPADPFEAMAKTVVDFDAGQTQEAPDVSRPRLNNRMPYPRPMPREPISYAQEGVYSLLEEIASSSWDSIYANASRPTRPAPSTDSTSSPRAGSAGSPQAGSAGSTGSLQASSGQAPGVAVAPLGSITSAPVVPALSLSNGRSVKRPAFPARRHPLNMPALATSETLPLRSGSRLQVDLSLQAPAIRAPRAVRAPRPDPDFAPTVPAAFHRLPKRKSLARRAWQTVGRALAGVRRRVVPPGAIMLF
jgi:pSer/pThr/pTyr-binding forkhead associated (FHA) protein